MKTQYQLQIVRIDNGFIIVASSDSGQRAKMQADSDEKCMKICHDLVDKMFEEPENKKA